MDSLRGRLFPARMWFTHHTDTRVRLEPVCAALYENGLPKLQPYTTTHSETTSSMNA